MDIRTIYANGLDFAYYEQGTGDNHVICLHGFPDTADTWRDLMLSLADAGYHVIAPFMRGYHPTQIPADAQYSSKNLAHDVIGLLDAFAFDTVTLIGHDWAALAAYSAVALAPERFDKLITVAIPHPRALRFDALTLWKARHFLTFQIRPLAVNWMKQNNYQALDTIFRRWSPNWQYTKDDIQPVRDCFAQAGVVQATLGYYWSFFTSASDPDVQKLNRAKTPIPTLSVFGDADGALTLSALDKTHNAFTAEYEQVVLPDVGHFLHREVPDDFAELVLKFLQG